MLESRIVVFVFICIEELYLVFFFNCVGFVEFKDFLDMFEVFLFLIDMELIGGDCLFFLS